MNYYIFRESFDTTEIGRQFPQVQNMSPNYPYNHPNSVWQMTNDRLDFTPNLDAFILHGHAKKTDMLSCVPISFFNNVLIKSNLEVLWDKCDSSPYQVFPASVHYRKQVLSYILLHFYTHNNEFVDFEKSHFCYRKKNREIIENVNINNQQEYEFKWQKYIQEELDRVPNTQRPQLRALVLDTKKINLDFFRLTNLLNVYIVSERFAELITQYEVTGAKLINVKDYKIRI